MKFLSRSKRTLLLASALTVFLSLWVCASATISASDSENLSSVNRGAIPPENLKSENNAYDIVMLIDKSGSMNFTDPRHTAVNAAKMFVDSLYTGVENRANMSGGQTSDRMTVSVVPFRAK